MDISIQKLGLLIDPGINFKEFKVFIIHFSKKNFHCLRDCKNFYSTIFKFSV